MSFFETYVTAELGYTKACRLSHQDSRALHCAASVAVPDPSDDEVRR